MLYDKEWTDRRIDKTDYTQVTSNGLTKLRPAKDLAVIAEVRLEQARDRLETMCATAIDVEVKKPIPSNIAKVNIPKDMNDKRIYDRVIDTLRSLGYDVTYNPCISDFRNDTINASLTIKW